MAGQGSAVVIGGTTGNRPAAGEDSRGPRRAGRADRPRRGRATGCGKEIGGRARGRQSILARPEEIAAKLADIGQVTIS